TSHAVDISKPFICPDISPNTIRVDSGKLKIGASTYYMSHENLSSIDWLTNSEFISDDRKNIIYIMQNQQSGNIDVSYMKLSKTIDSITPGIDMDKFKVIEKVSYDIGREKPSYLKGNNLGCKNLK
ncbi:hypothetical protein RYR54_003993, partial [Aeromonas sobria]|nr:hypothetical protein [Aeromonas sobria]